MKSSIFAALAAASLVSAHGTLSKFIANGKSYDGPLSGAASGDGVVRAISTVEPVMDFNSDAMTCGHGAKPAGNAAEVTAGSEVEFQMRNGDGGAWVHIIGPVIYSIYKCPGAAKDCNPGKDAGWAVVKQAGGDSSGWDMGKFSRGENIKVKIPSGTPNGEYIMRQELIALHNGKEMYTECVQIKVTGGPEGDLKSAGAQLTSYPGAYTGNEPELNINAYGMDVSTYKFPGPAPFTAEGSPAPPASDPTSPPPPPPTKAPTCKAKRAAAAASVARREYEERMNARRTFDSRSVHASSA